MARQPLNNGEQAGTFRSKLNQNFTELFELRTGISANIRAGSDPASALASVYTIDGWPVETTQPVTIIGDKVQNADLLPGVWWVHPVDGSSPYQIRVQNGGPYRLTQEPTDLFHGELYDLVATATLTSPTEGETDTAVNVVVTFSEAVDPATVTTAGNATGSFELYNKTSQSYVAGALSTANNTAWTFNPTSNLTAGHDYQVRLKTTIKTADGGKEYMGFGFDFRLGISGGGSANPGPTGVAVLEGNTTLTVSWDAVAGADSYNVYHSATSPVTTASTKITGATSPQLITGLTNEQVRYVAVTSVTGGVESDLSAEVSGTPFTPAAFDPANTNANITLSNGNRTIDATVAGEFFFSSYLNTSKTTGIWAFEMVNNVTMDGNNSLRFGARDTKVLDSSIGATASSVSYLPHVGGQRVDGTLSSGYWNTVTAAGSTMLVVIDYDTRILYVASSGTLKASSPVPGTNPIYVGATIYQNAVDALTATINCGQVAFNATSESLISALETTLGKSIPRGLGQ